MKTIYIAEVKYGQAKITSARVLKDTTRQIRVDEKTEVGLYGRFHYIPGILSKRTYHLFYTLAEAQDFCVEEIGKYIDNQKLSVSLAEAELAKFHKWMRE